MPKPPLNVPGLLRLLDRQADPLALAWRRNDTLEALYTPDERAALKLDLGLVVSALLMDADYRLSEIAEALDWPIEKIPVLFLHGAHGQRRVYEAEKRIAKGESTVDADIVERSVRIRAYLVSPPDVGDPWRDEVATTHPFPLTGAGC